MNDPIRLIAVGDDGRGMVTIPLTAYELLLESWSRQAERQRRARNAQAEYQRREMEHHVRQALCIRDHNPHQSFAAMAYAIANDCRREGRKCREETIRKHLAESLD